ncbi:biotin--[acetyl-CoA-carboxylase] ligase [Cellulomonas carbonis]|uniref:Biotin--acetyl-CoA-carboxylase ligase n=1 Tax=Cellulomonas carbonis T26 TaxID=947969 RepID=A0A0A0BSU0_9CELL|nr:biotin--[acetyl-CoA-carboxylase] ligase [Cellulomonas carbonis]KGM11026.1 biotin--acetyl-CoA-carboxylase ligase [Cellulomonas carbonis T26]GGB99632.1 biotin--[acetyl-CoA-carboxylase] ligase [Cellulomonas carbonis]
MADDDARPRHDDDARDRADDRADAHAHDRAHHRGDHPRVPYDRVAVERALRAGGATGRVVVVGRTASTSADLVAALGSEPVAWPDRSVLVADHQAAGRGRRGRTWTTPAHTAVTVSVVLRPGPDVPVDRWGWLPLVAGLAVVGALDEAAGVRSVLKWPNDVLVDAAPGDDALPGWGRRRKVAGLLGDVVPLPGGPAAVVGIGVNVDQVRDELPVPSASSLRLAGARAGVGREAVLTAVLDHLWRLETRWRAVHGDARAAGLDVECAAACATLGARVRVDLPAGREVVGVARSLGPDGSLEVVDGVGALHRVLAGDVHHMRSAD